ncbi:MAG: hypothetical protein R6W69_12830 [Anaerolineales bacterium]
MKSKGKERATSVHIDGWILTVKMASFMASGFVRFVGQSRPSSLGQSRRLS